MNNNLKKNLIVFIKYPEIGKVKTRLAKTLGDEFAFKFYQLCSEYTVRESEKLIEQNVVVNLFYSNRIPDNMAKENTGSKFKLFEQKGMNIGEKIQNAFQIICNKSSGKTIVIGTDLPDFTAELINNCFTLLDKFDAVIGPSNDGGYYLLGLKNYFPQIFQNIPWSTNAVLKTTLQILQKNKIKTKIIDELIDIDTELDLRNWLKLKKQKGHPFLNQPELYNLLRTIDER